VIIARAHVRPCTVLANDIMKKYTMIGNTLLTFGIVLVLVGVIVNVLGRFGFPSLPGDIFIQKENFTLYVPIATSIILSILLTILLNLFR
jgi:hypothetical protein